MIPFTCPCCEVPHPPHREGCTLHADGEELAEDFDEVSSMRAEITRFRAEIDRLRAERRWIPVTERLPDVDEHVLGCGDGWKTAAIAWMERRLWEEGQPIAWTCGEELDRGFTPEITHWQQLPPTPCEGEVEK